jgi:putative component of toxin-antitoxin plasmid stabilization module
MRYIWRMRVVKTSEYSDWLDALKDVVGRARVLMRVDRLLDGNPGAHRNITEGGFGAED